MTEQRIGIIDIGSNSIRLVIYERTRHGAYRVIDGLKQAGRLSQQIDEAGRLKAQAIDRLTDTLLHFRLLCEHHRTSRIRAVATAAIRNAANRDEILARLEREAGLAVELLSGDQEAAYGFIGMINTLNETDGFLIDIGGGSTELSLFRGRELVRSVSFPIGCVNMAARFTEQGMLDDKALEALEHAVRGAIDSEPWIREAARLPLIGLGGTARALAKLHQARIGYPFPQTHNYELHGQDADSLLDALRLLPPDKRRKTPGLSKDRVDLIVPGLAILRTFYRACEADRYIICGAGLRDGLFFDAIFPDGGRDGDALGYSVDNLTALYPEAPQAHVAQVGRLAERLFDALAGRYPLEPEARVWLRAAAKLFRIGAAIDYYHYEKHTFYLIVNSHLYGLSHRGILITAAVASYKGKNSARQMMQTYRPLLSEADLETIGRLGTLLQLAIALDRSESQPIGELRAEPQADRLLLRADKPAAGGLEIEAKEVENLADDFKKAWGLSPVLAV